MPDQQLTCRDCGQQFTFTDGEQEFYASKNLSAPQRCKACRTSRKNERATTPREMHDAVCEKCREQCQVPFKPRPIEEGGKAVLCINCFSAERKIGRAPPEDEVYLFDDYRDRVRRLREESPSQAEKVAFKKLDKIELGFQKLREQTRAQIQSLLNELSGIELPSLQSKQRIASEIRRKLRRMELAIACPQCERPSMVRAAAAGNSKQGVFQFEHSANGARSTHRGSSTLPQGLLVVDAPIDGRQRSIDRSAKTRQKAKRA